MKKYLQLTSYEAIRYFILKDKTLVPEAAHEIDFKLDNLKELKSGISISIVMPTHRTKPDYEIDKIQLKKLIRETEKELNNTINKRKAALIMQNIKEAHDHIDYSLNLDSLVIYANEHFASVVKLPVYVPVEIMIGENFDFRPLYKTRQQNRRYYILTISRNVIRLIEGFNDKVDHEVENNDFPFLNEYYVVEEIERMQDSFVDNQIKEYFNTADKRFQKYYNMVPLPVILAGDIKMTAYYQEQMDNGSMIIGHLHGSFDKMPYHEIIQVICPKVNEYREKKQQEYLTHLDTAISQDLLTTDLNEIYNAALEGAVNTLYIGDSYSMNGTIDNNQILVNHDPVQDINKSDLLTKLMKMVQDNGGNIIFVDDDKMEKYNGIALVRRY